MSLSNSLMIAIHEIRSSLDSSKPILENIKAAMKEAQKHWLIVDEEERFRAACGAVLLIANEDDKKILEKELKSLQTMSALQSGIPVDITTVLQDVDPKQFFGLLRIWKEIKQ